MGLLDDEFLTVADVAELLKRNQQTVRNWIEQGYLPALRVGRRVRVRWADLDELLAKGSIHPQHRTGPSAAEASWDGQVPDPLFEPAEPE